MKIKPRNIIQATSILLLSFLISSALYGQTKGTLKKIYLQGGLGFTTHNGGGGEIGIQTILKNNWVASLSYHPVNADPKNLPDDYEPDYVFFIPIYESVDINLFSLTGGKLFATGKNTWLTTEAGVTFGSGEKMTFTRTDPQFYIFGATSNYESKTEKKSLAGLMLKTDFDWAFASFMGLGTGVYANFNSVQSVVGFNIKLLVGNMGRVKKHKRG